MKKVKIMLMSLAVVAVVGGALAFKTRSTGLYCGTSTTSCPTQDNVHKYKFATSGSISGVFCTDNPDQTDVCVSITNE